MKLSKSILSPSYGRRHDPPLTLPTSLSRRLKTNNSIKGGGKSPMFPKKRGSSFENPEPSSPKVTCIGQVKMKTKKKVGKKRHDLSSFRKLEQQQQVSNNDSILNRSLSSTLHFQAQQCVRNQRWVHLPLMIYEALREFSCLFPCRSSKEKKERFISSGDVIDRRSSCNDVFNKWLVLLQDGDVENTRGVEIVVRNNEEMEEERENYFRRSRRNVFEDIEFEDEEKGKGKVSISIPPKNALLLMRCRSDPAKMADLTNRLIEEGNNNDDMEENKYVQEELMDPLQCEETRVSCDFVEEEDISNVAESIKDRTIEKLQGTQIPESEKEEEEEQESSVQRFSSFSGNCDNEWSENEEKSEKEDSAQLGYSRKQQNESVLPNCLLLMMCEPKLSMEVSKETWVCSNDFILPERKKPVKKQIPDIDCKPAHMAQHNRSRRLLQPPRSSCSLPAVAGVSALSMAAVIEQKLAAYEPFVLTRCKSEPMRMAAAAQLAPDMFGVGSARVGF